MSRHSIEPQELSLTPPQLARKWGVDVSKILTWIRSGELRAADMSKHQRQRPRYRVLPEDADAFLARRTVKPIPKPKRRRRRKQQQGVTQFYK